MAMGSHVLATDESSFVINNPKRGLALDPIGLSYTLPRLGQEFRQPSAPFPVGAILALTGYEADAADMVETGLATHYIQTFRNVAPLERILSELPSWEQQKLIKPDKTWYTGKSSSLEDSQTTDINAPFRNVSISHYLQAMSIYDAAGQELSNTPSEDEAEFWQTEDPSLVLHEDRGRAYGDRTSMLVNIAATMTFFDQEKTVVGIMERLKGITHRPAHDEEEKEALNIAKGLLAGMESASPLALLAVHRLMEMGKGKMESLEQCMEREARVQLNLMMHQDFQQWAKSGMSEGSFKGWKHKKVKDVANDEVEELFQEIK
jgi:enoyl-CoA hydratase/carnithine racemase